VFQRFFRFFNPGFKSLFMDHPARTAVFAILITVIWTNLGLKFWKDPERILVWDVKVFYVYLPATFIYQDLALEFILEKRAELGEVMYREKGPLGIYYIQATYGLSLLYSPFFLGAHAYARLTGGEATGYSPPYKFALILSCIFYLIIGLYYLKKFLLKFFSQWVTAITMVVIVLGTNLFYYSTYEGPMSHAYNFALIAIFLYFTTVWYEKINSWNTIILGFLLGLIALVRPVNFIIILFFVFYGVHSRETFKNRVFLLFRSYKLILLMIAIFFLIWVPQFLYWKFVSGSYFFYSYSDQRFYFNNPQVMSSLFSYRKGLFLYIPLIAIAFAGIPFLYRRFRGFLLPVGLFALFNVYILSSWCFWWFGGGFGPRSYIDTYAIMAIPFAALTSRALSGRWWLKVPYVLIVAALVWFNLFQTKQYYNGAISWMGMTKEAYWDSFLRRYPSSEFWDMLRFPDPSMARKGIYYQGDLTLDELYPVNKSNMPNDGQSMESEKRERYIRNTDKFIRKDKAWFKQMQQKAARDGISVDSAIRRDAIWLYEKERKKQEPLSSPDMQ
jgi:hypothetical protein